LRVPYTFLRTYHFPNTCPHPRANTFANQFADSLSYSLTHNTVTNTCSHPRANAFGDNSDNGVAIAGGHHSVTHVCVTDDSVANNLCTDIDRRYANNSKSYHHCSNSGISLCKFTNSIDKRNAHSLIITNI